MAWALFGARCAVSVCVGLLWTAQPILGVAEVCLEVLLRSDLLVGSTVLLGC